MGSLSDFYLQGSTGGHCDAGFLFCQRVDPISYRDTVRHQYRYPGASMGLAFLSASLYSVWCRI